MTRAWRRCIVDSFTGRGVRRTVADQTLVSGAQMEGDAFAALALLRRRSANRSGADRRDGRVQGRRSPRSTAAIAVRQRWRGGFDHLFDLHVAICPGATAQHRDPATHGRPIYFMLAGRDDYTPAPLAIDYAERMRAAGNRRIKVKVYSGAHHGWESLGPVFDIRDAENWSCCKQLHRGRRTPFRGRRRPRHAEAGVPGVGAYPLCHARRPRRRRHGGAQGARDGRPAGLSRGPRIRRGKTATARGDLRTRHRLGVSRDTRAGRFCP